MKANETNISLEDFLKELQDRTKKFERNVFTTGGELIRTKTFSQWLELFVAWNDN